MAKQKLVTYTTYAELAGTSKQVISARVKAGTLKAVEFDGIPFIDANAYPPDLFEKKKEGRPKKSKKKVEKK